jgi:hypothetical protein
LLRDAARTLMKATTLIRKHGLKNRMGQEPLEFLSDMNTLCMKMTAKGKASDGRKQRKKVLREMKTPRQQNLCEQGGSGSFPSA